MNRNIDFTFDTAAWYPTRARVAMHRMGPLVEIEGAVFSASAYPGKIEVAGFRSQCRVPDDMKRYPGRSWLRLKDLTWLFSRLYRETLTQPRYARTSLAFVGRMQPRRAFFTPHVA